MTRTHVRRILFDGKRAVGVEVEVGGTLKRIGARREVIVSGGSINSPVLLLNSGVGPAAELKRSASRWCTTYQASARTCRITCRPGSRSSHVSPGTLNEILTSPRQQVRMALEWLTSCLGPARGRGD